MRMRGRREGDRRTPKPVTRTVNSSGSPICEPIVYGSCSFWGQEMGGYPRLIYPWGVSVRHHLRLGDAGCQSRARHQARPTTRTATGPRLATDGCCFQAQHVPARLALIQRSPTRVVLWSRGGLNPPRTLPASSYTDFLKRQPTGIGRSRVVATEFEFRVHTC